ncbi:MAG TPA: hypothetical protein VD886_25825 [Herpetosiphonaceae bacterium]|nr:hypothetical protein [Herpetosiphonaceae bacterium]
MTCRTIRKLAGEQDSDPAVSAIITEHLETCPMCQDELGEIPAALVAPQSAIPPPRFVANIMAQLPPTPAIAAAAERRRVNRSRLIWGVFAAAMALVVLLGAYGVMVDSSAPAQIFGGLESSLGRGVLALTLAGKPMVAALGALGLPLLVIVALGGTVVPALWKRLAAPPAALLVEVER